MKIYTKGGDKGETSLIGGKRVSKSNVIVEAYGTIDELVANIGFLRSNIDDRKKNDFLVFLQSELMKIASLTAAYYDVKSLNKFIIDDNSIKKIENEIDEMQASMAPQKHFIIPGSNEVVALCHICRTITRKTERKLVNVKNECIKSENNSYFKQFEKNLMFINRLSDYFFVLSCRLSIELGVDENKWIF